MNPQPLAASTLVLLLLGGLAPVWQVCAQPPAPQFAMQSNWFRTGMRYAQLLDDSGNTK